VVYFYAYFAIEETESAISKFKFKDAFKDGEGDFLDWSVVPFCKGQARTDGRVRGETSYLILGENRARRDVIGEKAGGLLCEALWRVKGSSGVVG
jgi:hypothetical protein